MCGICGVCLTDRDAPVSESVLRDMTDCLQHRGPDGQGFLTKGNIGLGHRRLSIIDLQGGDQPIYNEDGNVAIVFNGEIYNYLELIPQLTAQGHRFKTRSDTEVIVHLYEQYGRQCVEHLRGMFTFAIWDGRDGSVFLARDRLGIKPLFYLHTPQRLLFASELKSIIQDPSVPREVDVDTLGEYLAYGYIPGDRCILRGVSKLLPGHTFSWRAGRVDVQQYWDVAFPDQVASDAPDLLENLMAVLREAVSIHLRSDVPVGVLLSGGVDSAIMVALASLELGKPVKTFSVGFEEEDFNEIEVARLSAKRYNTEHIEIIVKDRDASVLPDIVWHLDEPFADPSALPTYYVCREAAKHVKVCLSGDGADEIFGGYTRYRDAMSYRYVDWIPSAVRRAVCDPVGALIPPAVWGKGLVGRIGASGPRRYLDTVGVFPAGECAAVLHPDVAYSADRLTRFLDPYFANNARNTLTTLQHADQKTYLPDDILVKVDRMSMQNSLEIRPPFLDHRVAEFGNRCPPSVKLRHGVCKAILKDLAHDLIPPEVIRRPKTGFGMPIKHWFRKDMETMACDVLLTPSARSAAFFQTSAVRRIITDHQRGMRDLSRKIWSLLVFEQWCRRFGV